MNDKLNSTKESIQNNKKTNKEKIAKIIRVLTTAPIIAFVMLSIIYFVSDLEFGLLHYIMAIVFLCVLPLLAYPLSYLIKPIKCKGRNGQRNLAIVFSLIGYVFGIVFGLITNAPNIVLNIYFTYLFSGILIALFSFVIKFKSSGHASGVAGPIAMLVYVFGPIALLGSVVLVVVYWSSIILKRHSIIQLLSGTIVPIIALFFATLIVGVL